MIIYLTATLDLALDNVDDAEDTSNLESEVEESVNDKRTIIPNKRNYSSSESDDERVVDRKKKRAPSVGPLDQNTAAAGSSKNLSFQSFDVPLGTVFTTTQSADTNFQVSLIDEGQPPLELPNSIDLSWMTNGSYVTGLKTLEEKFDAHVEENRSKCYFYQLCLYCSFMCVYSV